jgi:O-antigen ligase
MLYRVKGLFTQDWPRFWRKNFTRFLWVYLAISCVSVMLTYSRAGMLGLVGAFMLIGMRQGNFTQRLKQLCAVCVVSVIAFFFLPQDIQYRIESIWDDSVEAEAGMKGANTSAEGRREGLQAGIEMFTDHPLMGVGIGNFKAYRVAKGDGIFLSAHNLPGELLGETGMLGTLAFAIVLATFLVYWRPVRRLAKRSTDPTIFSMNELVLACRDCVIILVYASITQHTLQRYYWFLIGAFSVLAFRFARAAAREEQSLVEDQEEPELVHDYA